MTTRETKELPEIEWERGELEDTDDHMKFYSAFGESMDGRLWCGEWQETDGEHVEIVNIELHSNP